MLFNSFGRQQAARCCQQTSYSSHGRNSIQLQRRPFTVLLPCRSPGTKVLSAKDASNDRASSSSSRASSSSSSASSASSSYPFFNRSKELSHLADLCSAPPDAISVILGPRSAGKTALLTEFMCQRGLLDSRCLIDARETPINTPSDLARALMKSAIPKLAQQLFPGATGTELAKAVAGVLGGVVDKHKSADGSELTISGGFFAPVAKALAGEVSWAQETAPLAMVTEAYAVLLDAWNKARAAGSLKDDMPPVLVVDEANVLMAWGDQYKAERQDLLQFFVAVTKARRCSHVILATSEYSFLSWLSKELGPTFYESFVVGDFPAHEARGFLDSCLQQAGKPEVVDADWEAVHQVCGGNAGALVMAASRYDSRGGWKAATSRLVKDVWRTMHCGYRPTPDAGYTAADYATAVDAILKSPYKAVDDEDLIAVLGQQSLEAMVQATLLALRPYSHWAADIDAAAFGVDLDATVVTAPSPLHLDLMEHKHSIIMAALETQRVPLTSNTNHGARPSRPPSPTSVAVRAVADEIERSNARLMMLKGRSSSSEMRSLVSGGVTRKGWLEDLAFLQQEKQQRVEEERQLRDKKGRLQERKLLLTKLEG